MDFNAFLNSLPDINRSPTYPEAYGILHQFQESLKEHVNPKAQIFLASIRAVLNESIKVAELEKAVKTMRIVRPGHGKRESVRLDMKPLTGEEKQRIITEFQSGRKPNRIAEDMHRPPSQVKNVLRRCGLIAFGSNRPIK